VDASYPPYNIETTGENAYRLTMAVAGFGSADLEITVKDNALLVSGKSKSEDDAAKYLHRGIRDAPSSAASGSPSISRSRARASTMACSMSTSCARFPRR
jgi:hypothetical protein